MIIDTENHLDFKMILEEFGYKTDENTDLLMNNKLVWEFIINIRNNMIEEIGNTIRVNLQLCYLLEVEAQIKEINSPLFKLNYIFEQNFYCLGNDPAKSLFIFYKLINNTYININYFINEIRDLKENLYFIRKHHDRVLVEKYNYLRKISLPLRGYEELRFSLLTLMKKFTNIATLIKNPEAYNSLMTEYNIFITKYKELYINEHEKYHNKLKEFYKKLYSLSEYKVLDYLSCISIIKVAYNLKPIRKYIETFFPDPCKISNLDELLENQTRCKCGFYPGQNLSIPSLNKIKPMLKKGIIEYMEKLHNQRFKNLFNNYLNYKPGSLLKEILEIPPANIIDNLELISKDLIVEINEALSNTFPLQISFNEISHYLSGVYSANDLELLLKDLENIIRKIIRDKIEDMADINYDEIVINLIK